MKTIIPITLLLLASSLMSQAQGRLPLKVEILLAKLNEWETNEKATFDKNVQAKRGEVAVALKTYLKETTQSGDLKTANLIQAKINELSSTATKTMAKGNKLGGDKSNLEAVVKKLVSKGACTAKLENGAILFSGSGFVTFDELVKPPFKLTLKLIPSGEIRLYYANNDKSAMIFNWSDDPQQFRYHEYIINKQKGAGVQGKGFLQPGETHEITWDFRESGVRISANGRLIHRFDPEQKNIVGKIGIGSHTKSTIQIQEWTLEK